MTGDTPQPTTLRLPRSLLANAVAFAAGLMRLVIALLAVVTRGSLPAWLGARLIGRPLRLPVLWRPFLPGEDFHLRTEDGLRLRGWLFKPTGSARGLIVYLHGHNQNRRRGLHAARRYVPRGFAVLTSDLRAHGASGGARCTFGILESRDLRRALEQIGLAPAVLIGESLGAATALLAAADEPRIQGVVAAATYASLDSTLRERARGLNVDPSLRRFESEAGIRVSDASPRDAAPRIRASTLVIHGGRDRSTLPHHSEEVFAALTGPKEWLVVEGAGHNDLLKHAEVWDRIDDWLERTLSPAPVSPPSAR